MIGYIKKLGQLGFSIDYKLSVDLVSQLLPQSFSQFIMNYHINKLESTLPEVLNMLKTTERTFKKENKLVLLVQSSRCLIRRIRKIRVISLKQRSLLRALRKIRVFVNIVAMMAIEEGIARNILQLWRERNLLRFLIQVCL
jgi:hypothetical protein